jgi:hypothetical protein
MTSTRWKLIGRNMAASSLVLSSISILPPTSRSALFPQGMIWQGLQKCCYGKFVTLFKTAKSLIAGIEISYVGEGLFSTAFIRTHYS